MKKLKIVQMFISIQDCSRILLTTINPIKPNLVSKFQERCWVYTMWYLYCSGERWNFLFDVLIDDRFKFETFILTKFCICNIIGSYLFCFKNDILPTSKQQQKNQTRDENSRKHRWPWRTCLFSSSLYFHLERRGQLRTAPISHSVNQTVLANGCIQYWYHQ